MPSEAFACKSFSTKSDATHAPRVPIFNSLKLFFAGLYKNSVGGVMKLDRSSATPGVRGSVNASSMWPRKGNATSSMEVDPEGMRSN